MSQSYVPTLPAHGWLGEPALSFHPDRAEDRSVHPLEGLLTFGPYSRSLLNHVIDPIRVAMIVPYGGAGRVRGLLVELEQEHPPRERRNYLPRFPGFARVFGLRLVAADPALHIELPRELDAQIATSARPHQDLAAALTRALDPLAMRRHEYDVVLLYLPTRWEPAFLGAAGEDFDLHDYVKVLAAIRSVPTQIVRDDASGALTYFCRASVGWRLGIALYAKAGGIPWKLANAAADTAYIGLSYALRPTGDPHPFVTCCSQVFDADGAGLEFLVYETDAYGLSGKNPYLGRAEMRRVLARSLRLYQRRNPGRSPRRVVVHKSTEFKRDEIAGVFDALEAVPEVELVQVKQDVGWRGIHISGLRIPANYPVERGSYMQLGGREALLWTQGNVATALGGRNFFKEGKGIPAPLELIRFAGQGSLEQTCLDVLSLTKMNWNNDSLYDFLPVTLGYAHVLARVAARVAELQPREYQLRFFM